MLVTVIRKAPAQQKGEPESGRGSASDSRQRRPTRHKCRYNTHAQTHAHTQARTHRHTQAGTHRHTGRHAAQTDRHARRADTGRQAGRQAGTPHRRRQAQAGTDTQTHARTLAHLNSLHREGLKDRDAGRTHAHTLTHCSTLSSYQAKGRFFLPPHWSFSLSLDLPT